MSVTEFHEPDPDAPFRAIVPAMLMNSVARFRLSVDDVQSESQSNVQFGAFDVIEATDGFSIEICDRYGDDVVASDDASFGQSLFGTDLGLGADSADRAGDGCARDRGQDRDGCITRENTDRATSCRRTKVSPHDVVASYHAGAVSAARRRADWTSAGSGG